MESITVEDSIKVPTGNYTMQCVKVEARKQTGKKDKNKVYDLIDYIFIVKVPIKGDVELRLSFFRESREASSLMQFLAKFGANIKVGSQVQPDFVLNQWCTADVTNPANEFGVKYSEISADSIVKIAAP